MDYNIEDRLTRIEKIQENINNQLNLFSSLIDIKMQGKEIDSLLQEAKIDYNRLLMLSNLLRIGIDNIEHKDSLITEMIGFVTSGKDLKVLPYNNWKNYLVVGKDVFLRSWLKRHFTLSNINLLNREELLKNVRLPEQEINECIYIDYKFMLMFIALPNWREVYNIGKHKYKLKEKVDNEISEIKPFNIRLNGVDYAYSIYTNLTQKHDFEIFNLYNYEKN